MDFKARKIRIMKELWELSEEAERIGEKGDAILLCAAGNIVEDTFCSGEPADLMLSSITNATEE